MTASAPVRHGDDHRPGGIDPSAPGPRHNIGTTGEPAYDSGWSTMAPTVDIPVPVPMYFLVVIGRLNLLNEAGDTILQYNHKVLEIGGDIDGGADNTTVFTLPLAYRFEEDRPFPGHDTAGLYVPSRLYTDGRFVRGTP